MTQPTRSVNAWRFQELAAKKRPPTREQVGMERAQALQKEPVEEHVFPYGSRSAHTASRSCSCRPTLRTTDVWWKVEAVHQVIVPEDRSELSWDEFDDRRWMESQRRR
jgi:hypothetical protein